MQRKKPSTFGPLALLVFASAPQAAEHRVEARPSLTFSPADLTITQGETVRFENTGGFHNVRQVDSEDDTRAERTLRTAARLRRLCQRGSTVIAFDQPGVYHYLCQVPRNGMRGRISVLPETVAPQIFVNGFEGS